MFRAPVTHHQGKQSYKQTLGHIVTFNIRKCGEMINVCFTDSKIYTMFVAAYSFECDHSTVNTLKPMSWCNYCVHIRICKSYIDHLTTVQ
jgi:hypothetical protein